MKLYISAAWNESDLSKTWSGTSYQLYKELSTLCEVERITPPKGLVVRILTTLSRKTGCFWFKKLKTEYENYCLKRQIKDNQTPVLSIGAIRAIDAPTYIYVDNLYASCLLFKEYQKEGWGYNPWGNLSDKYIKDSIEYEHRVIQKAKAVFCMGVWLTEHARKIYPDCADKIYVACGGLNSIAENTQEDRDRNNVLFVGRDFKRKSGDLVVEAIRILNEERGMNVRLNIAGPKIKPQNCEYPWLTFLGDIPYSETGRLMKKASLFCMPSRFEAYGLVFAEALVAGTPCIGRDAFEMNHFIQAGKTGELIRRDDACCLADKISEILKNEAYIYNVKNRHKEYIVKYNWHTTALKVFEKISEDGDIRQ